MSALGQKRTSRNERAMSALPPKADIDQPPKYGSGYRPSVLVRARPSNRRSARERPRRKNPRKMRVRKSCQRVKTGEQKAVGPP
jgi:hypothetical protein